MIITTLHREKCIGCNYCAEFAPEFFCMSKKDGKSVLLRSTEKKGFHTLKLHDNSGFGVILKAVKVCPVKIISVRKYENIPERE